jgi:hypothetical protein
MALCVHCARPGWTRVELPEHVVFTRVSDSLQTLPIRTFHLCVHCTVALRAEPLPNWIQPYRRSRRITILDTV